MAKTGNLFKPESLLTKRVCAAAGRLSREIQQENLTSCFSVKGPEPRAAVDSKNDEAQPHILRSLQSTHM